MLGFLRFAETAAPQRVGNRRITIRYRCAPATAGKVFTSDDQEFQRAWIENLSLGGVGLFLSKPIAVGHSVIVQLKSPTSAGLYDLTGTVAHASLRDPYGYFVGIRFDQPIDNETLDALL
jgi:hypothetical protein